MIRPFLELKSATDYPSVADLKKRAQRRLPKFAYEHLAGGLGRGRAVRRNEEAFEEIQLTPKFLVSMTGLDTSTELFGQRWSVPLGISPVGFGGLFWPGSELELACQAKTAGIPYTQSTFSNETIEDAAKGAKDSHWFQLSACKDFGIMEDLMNRAHESGVKTLMVTVDTPEYSKREHDYRNGITPASIPLLKLAPQVARRPAWALRAAKKGRPTLKTLDAYVPKKDKGKAAGNSYLLDVTSTWYDWALFNKVRKHWSGNLILKGAMDIDMSRTAIEHGADALLVSNHGGRQFDAAPPTVSLLPRIRDAFGDSTKILLDSGVRSGLDILRAIEFGADFCLSGRPFYYALAALGERGAEFVISMLADELRREMKQYGRVNWAKPTT